jgi:hypothetical protein
MKGKKTIVRIVVVSALSLLSLGILSAPAQAGVKWNDKADPAFVTCSIQSGIYSTDGVCR